MSEQLSQALAVLQELAKDSTIPKNVQKKVTGIIGMLQQNGEISLNVSKAMHELEELTEDSNIESFTRMQIFNVVSILEVVG